MRLSARNKLPGVVESIERAGFMAKVGVRIGDNHLVAVVSAESIDDLQLQVGDTVTAVVKSTSVMLAK